MKTLARKGRLLAKRSGVSEKSAVEMQRAYYAQTAAAYDDMHVREDDEHGFALSFLISAVGQFGIRSILDVGCGTGRALIRIKEALPGIEAVGIEPSAELRAVGHSKGLSKTELVEGDATRLAFGDGSFDLNGRIWSPASCSRAVKGRGGDAACGAQSNFHFGQ